MSANHHTDVGYLSPISFFLMGLAFLYLFAAAQQAITQSTKNPVKQHCWSHWRSLSFISGLFLLFIALSPPINHLAHHDLRVHMLQHLLIGMFAPLAFALAAPLTLMLRSLPVSASRRLVNLLHSAPVYWLSHPVTALWLNIGGMYLLYLTPLYATSLTNPVVHYFVHIHFFLAGYLFTWSIAGHDPAPRRAGFRMRIIVLFLAIVAHTILSKLMYIHGFPFNTPHTIEEIRSAAKIMYYGGDVAEMLLLVALFHQFYFQRKKFFKYEYSNNNFY